MSSALLILVTLLYMGIALSFVAERQYGLAVMYLFYALANVGVLLAARGI